MSGQLSKQALKKLKKKIDVEYDSRTDITGHFKSEYDQGFCDGADWFFKLAEKEAVSPSLTDDQQVVLEWLTENIHLGTLPFNQISLLNQSFFNSPMDTSDKYLKAFGDLDSQEQFQVLAAFANYGLEGNQ